MTDKTILIKKGGCSTYVTLSKFERHYKQAGYVIVETEKKTYNTKEMSYQELQALFSEKTGESAVGVSKVDLIERLNEVL